MERKKLIHIETDDSDYDLYGLSIRVTYRNIFKRLKVKWVCVVQKRYKYTNNNVKPDTFFENAFNDLNSIYEIRRLNWIKNRRYNVKKNKLK